MTGVIKTVSEWKSIRHSKELAGKKIGFVPTMGALHGGHESLFKKSVEQNDVTVVSIFVNPTQFNDPQDLQNYPQTFEQDLAVLEKNKVDYLFFPGYEEIYADNYSYHVSENSFSKILCGAYRPNHFEGVLTVVLKLLNIISPDRAYFGEKDYQQFILIKQMCKAFFLDIEIISSSTIREEDGLAMSSRNKLLTDEERILAAEFPKLLRTRKDDFLIKTELRFRGFRVDYVETIDGKRFGAVHIGKVRLIDNVQL